MPESYLYILDNNNPTYQSIIIKFCDKDIIFDSYFKLIYHGNQFISCDSICYHK